jgi:hypothetical protein
VSGKAADKPAEAEEGHGSNSPLPYSLLARPEGLKWRDGGRALTVV